MVNFHKPGKTSQYVPLWFVQEIDQRLSAGLLVDEDIQVLMFSPNVLVMLTVLGQREQTVLLLQSWVYKCLDHVHMIDREWLVVLLFTCNYVKIKSFLS